MNPAQRILKRKQEHLSSQQEAVEQIKRALLPWHEKARKLIEKLKPRLRRAKAALEFCQNELLFHSSAMQRPLGEIRKFIGGEYITPVLEVLEKLLEEYDTLQFHQLPGFESRFRATVDGHTVDPQAIDGALKELGQVLERVSESPNLFRERPRVHRPAGEKLFRDPEPFKYVIHTNINWNDF